MVGGFKEAETFESVVTASLLSEYCSLLWAGKKEKKTAPLVIKESTEPANGSGNSNLFHCAKTIELDNS